MLQEDLYTATAHSIIAERQLVEILGVFQNAKVTSVVVKGAAVASFYPDRALRRYGDLDLWVREEDLQQAEEVLLDLGYAYAKSKAWWLREHQHLPPLRSERRGLPVELHWCLDRGRRPGRLPTEDLWTRAVPWQLGGEPALRLDPVDTVLHLCRHAVVQHRARLGLRALCDFAQATATWAPTDWESLARRAKVYALARPVYLMLSLVERVLGRPAPAEVISALEPPSHAALPDNLLDLFLERDGAAAPSVPLAVVRAGVEQTLLGRLHHLLRHLVLPRDGMAAVYKLPADSPRIWLAYLWRPLHLLGRYGRSTWHMLRGQQSAQTAWAREVWLEEWLWAKEVREPGPHPTAGG
jgi:hypothetical protein